MICAYCKKDRAATQEHVIPKGVIDLFPECDYVFDRRVNGLKVFKAETKIKDVCAECNNERLSILDQYGTSIIREYFVKEYGKDDKVELKYEYSLLSRWLLKILFNCQRTLHGSTKWFENNLDYILGDKDKSNNLVSIFGGLFVNTSPMPLFWGNNIQLQIISNPIMLIEGLLQPIGSLGTNCKINKKCEDIKLENLDSKWLIKFGSIIFLVLLWDDNAVESIVHSYESVINSIFPHKLLPSDGRNIIIERCNHVFNVLTLQIVDSCVGMSYADSTNCYLPLGRDPEDINRELSIEWNKYVDEMRNKKLKEKKNTNRA